MKNPSQEFLVNKWLVRIWFMGLGNPLDIVVHYLLIGGMVSLGHRDKFPVVGALVCMVTHWTRSTMNHDLMLSNSHDFTKLLHCVVSQHWENIEIVLKLTVALTYKWDCKLIIYSLWIGYCWWKLVVISIFNRGTMISHGIKIECLLKWSQGGVFMKTMVKVAP